MLTKHEMISFMRCCLLLWLESRIRTQSELIDSLLIKRKIKRIDDGRLYVRGIDVHIVFVQQNDV